MVEQLGRQFGLGVLSGDQQAQCLDDVPRLGSREAVDLGNGFLGQIFGDKEVSREVARRARRRAYPWAELMRRVLDRSTNCTQCRRCGASDADHASPGLAMKPSVKGPNLGSSAAEGRLCSGSMESALTIAWNRRSGSRGTGLSCPRNSRSPGGTDGLGRDAGAKRRLDRFLHDEIDRAPEKLAESLLHAEELEQADGPVELNEQIDVAVEPVLSASDGAEEAEAAHAECGDPRGT